MQKYQIAVLLVLLFLSPLKVASLTPMEEEARREYYQGNLHQAKELYQTLIQQDRDPLFLFDLSLIYRELGLKREALAILEELVYLEPNEPRWFRELGIFYYTQVEYHLAKIPLERSLSLFDQREAYYFLGLTLKELQDLEGAVAMFKRALEIDAYFALAHYQLALLYDDLKRIHQAIEYYLLALRYDSSMTGIHTLLGERYLEIGEYRAAFERFSRAVMVDANPHNKARLEEMKDRFPQYTAEAPMKPQAQPEIIWKRPEPASPSEDIPLVRIMLLQGVETMNLMTGGSFFIRDGPKGPILGQGEGRKVWHLQKKGHLYLLSSGNVEYEFHQHLYLEMIDKRDTFLLFHVQYGLGYFWAGIEDRQYRGDLEIVVDLDGLMAINHLQVEEYLYSVVPSEMPASWPIEALKAQAVAARSYTMRRLGGEFYDLCSTVHCAVYRGLNAEHPRTKMAVDATRGEVMMVQGEIIDAVYSSNVGGHTESSASIWGGVRSYLQPVSTDYKEKDTYLSPSQLRSWLMESPRSYSNYPPFASPNLYRWVRRFLVADLEARHPDLGKIQDIHILSRGEGGTVLSMAVMGQKGERILSSDSIRGFFNQLRSSRFFIETIYRDGAPKELLFYGGGFGHGVGMGQCEAAAMAQEGFRYTEILDFFYQGIERVLIY